MVGSHFPILKFQSWFENVPEKNLPLTKLSIQLQGSHTTKGEQVILGLFPHIIQLEEVSLFSFSLPFTCEMFLQLENTVVSAS